MIFKYYRYVLVYFSPFSTLSAISIPKEPIRSGCCATVAPNGAAVNSCDAVVCAIEANDHYVLQEAWTARSAPKTISSFWANTASTSGLAANGVFHYVQTFSTVEVSKVEKHEAQAAAVCVHEAFTTFTTAEIPARLPPSSWITFAFSPTFSMMKWPAIFCANYRYQKRCGSLRHHGLHHGLVLVLDIRAVSHAKAVRYGIWICWVNQDCLNTTKMVESSMFDSSLPRSFWESRTISL